MLYQIQFLWQMDGINFVYISTEYSVAYNKGWINMLKQKSLTHLLFYKAVLHYKIFPTTYFHSLLYHKTLGSKRTKYFYPGNFHICIHSSLLTEGHTRKIPCSVLHFEAVTSLPNLDYGSKQTLEPWLRCSVDSVLCAFKSNCKVREMSCGIVHSGCFKSTTQRRDLVWWSMWEPVTKSSS
jgi:hypothetical protein